ncbi:hypothetical protein TB2_025129 [Malus domestica]
MGKEGKAAEPENMDAQPLGVHNIKIQPFKLLVLGPMMFEFGSRLKSFSAQSIIPKSQLTLCSSPSTNRNLRG